MQDQVDVSGLTVTNGADTSFYTSYLGTNPLAIQCTGFYFKGSAYMQAPPNTADSNYVNFLLQLLLQRGLIPKSNGTVFCSQNSVDFIAVQE